MAKAADEFTRAAEVEPRRWVTGLRLVTGAFIVGSLFLLRFQGPDGALNPLWFESGLLIVGLYIPMAILQHLYAARRGMDRAGLILQLLGDQVPALCIILVSGGGESPFAFLFLVMVINCAFLGGLRLALTAATFSAVLWSLVLLLPNIDPLSEWLSFLPAAEKIPLSGDLAVNILINTCACYLVAVLSGRLAGQIIQSRLALSHSQAQLARLSDLNESIVKSINSGLITTDTRGLILSVNPAGLSILGKTSEEVHGRSWRMFLPRLEEILALPARRRFDFLGTVGGLRFEYFRESDRSELVLELDVMALMDKKNEIWGRLMVLNDFTSLSRMKAEVKKAERLAALGEMAAGLAHEVRTPLASMTGALDMLQNNLHSPEDQGRLMAIIGREMERLSNLSNDFLSFARPSPPRPQAFDLNAAIGEQLKIFKYSLPEGRLLSTDLRGLPDVYFDRDKFIQILWNLLTNALEAGEKSERLEIRVETAPDPDRSGHALMRVSDSGPGLSDEVLAKIFEPFFSTKRRGGGLGLPTVSRLLHEGGGGINAVSKPGEGAAFTIFLPLA